MGERFSLKRLFLFLFPVAILVFIDQRTKFLAVSCLSGNDPVILLEGVLELSFVRNSGAAFGVMQGMRPIFIVLSIVITCYCFILFLKIPDDRRFFPFMISLIMISAGAAGNLIDRLLNGSVVDFIYFRLIDFPVFNFADILVTCSTFFLVFLFLFIYKEEDIARIPFRLF